MSKKEKFYNLSANWKADSHIGSLDKYKELYKASIKDPDEFWSRIAKRISWYKPWDKVREFNFKEAKI